MTSRGAPEIEAADLPNQPADASFVLTQVLQRAEERADPFHNLLDGSHVAAAGHSEGALTTLGLFTACCRDSRLRAGIVLAGDAIGFERYSFTGASAPMLFVHGDADPLVPIGLARQAYARVPWSKGFITLPGAAHILPYIGDDNPAGGVVDAATTDFLNWALRGDPAGLQALRKDAGVPGVATLEDQL